MKVTIVLALTLMTVTASYAETPSIADKLRVAQIPQSSIQCGGFAPVPPLGCRVGACVCDRDAYGRMTNCHWTFVCN
jgi:hypothetical protein